MLILTVHWDMRLMWAVLTITAKFYILFLLAATVYSASCLALVAVRLRRLLTHRASTDMSLNIVEMTKRVESLRQFYTLLFLLFGLCCANEVFATLRTIQYSSMSLSAAKMDVFEPVTAFTFLVFVALTFLHAFQWAVAARQQSASAVNR
jgi:hypothetical protein